MKRFLKRSCLFFLPLIVMALIVLIIDPYNYFFSGNFIPDEIKFKVVNLTAESMPRGNTLWKYIDFKNHPSKNILIGDSRAYDLDVDTIRKISGIDFYNFGVPGGNYNSVIETFWYTTSFIKPEKVYIQVGFHNYSATSNYNLVADARKVCKRPYFFFSRFYFLKESILDVVYWIRGTDHNDSKENFNLKNWNAVLENQGNHALITMKYPDEYYKELKKISNYCEENGIELVFIIFPDQQDFHDLILKNSVEDLYVRYKKDIHSLGKVYDFDQADSPLISSRSNYRDIYHLKHDIIYNTIIPAILK